MKSVTRLPKEIKLFNQFNKLGFLIALLAFSQTVQAQVALTNQISYSQNFNSLQAASAWTNNATIPNWYVALNGSKAITGGDGSNATTGIRSFGNDGSSDRALGAVAIITTGEIYFGVKFKNTSNVAIDKLEITYSLEEWRGYLFFLTEHGELNFSYKKGTGITDLTAGTWNSFPALDATGTGVGSFFGAKALDGNLNKTIITAALPVNLAPNEEIMLRWARPATNVNNFLSIDDLTVKAVSNVFYNKLATNGTPLDVTNKLNWGINTDGSGITPADFNTGTFIFTNNSKSSYNLPANLTIGSNAKLVVSKGSLSIPAANNKTLTGIVDVEDNATLVIANPVMPTLGKLSNSSFVDIEVRGGVLPAASFGNLTITNGDKSLGGDLLVRNNLSLDNNSNVILGENDLTLAPGATISGAGKTAFIVTDGHGALKRTVANNNAYVEFPVGRIQTNGKGNYLPIKLKQTTSAILDVFSVRAIDSVYEAYTNNKPTGKALKKNAENTTWIIDENVKGGSNMTITIPSEKQKDIVNLNKLTNSVNGLDGFDLDNAKIVHYENNQWDYAPNLPTALNIVNALLGEVELSRSGITSFSPFSKMSGTMAPLPVELVSFEAKRAAKTVVTTWETASELNNAYFTVERSTDGREFTAVGTVKGKGTTAEASRYSFSDLAALAGLSYYRLRQTDLDGTTSYSKIVTVAGTGKTEVAYQLYPNPSSGQSLLQTSAGFNSPVQVTILNAQGKVVKEQTLAPTALNNGVEINLAQQAAGVYLVRISADNETTVLRAIKK